jgi:acyl carrier protein
MSSKKERIINAIYSAIETYNSFQPKEQRLEKNVDTILFSRAGFTKEGKLDSLGLVNLLVLVEEKMKVEFGNEISIDIPAIIEKREKLLVNLSVLIDYFESNLNKN